MNLYLTHFCIFIKSSLASHMKWVTEFHLVQPYFVDQNCFEKLIQTGNLQNALVNMHIVFD